MNNGKINEALFLIFGKNPQLFLYPEKYLTLLLYVCDREMLRRSGVTLTGGKYLLENNVIYLKDFKPPITFENKEKSLATIKVNAAKQDHHLSRWSHSILKLVMEKVDSTILTHFGQSFYDYNSLYDIVFSYPEVKHGEYREITYYDMMLGAGVEIDEARSLVEGLECDAYIKKALNVEE